MTKLVSARWTEPLLMAAVVIVVILIMLLATSGCSSTPKRPCPEPEIKVVVQKEAVPCIVVIEPLPLPDLPPIPPWPHDADEEEVKAWVLALGQAIEEQVKVMRAREAAWLAKVEAHNAGMPKCADQ